MSAAKMFVTQQCAPNVGEFPLFLFASGPKPVYGGKTACPRRKNTTSIQDTANSNLGSGYNLMWDPRVCRGSYVMDLGPSEDALYYPCFEMVKKDPLCQLYLRGLQKNNCSKNKTITSTIKKIGAKKSSQSSLRKALLAGEKVNSECQTDLYTEILQNELLKVEQNIQTDPLSEIDPIKLGKAKQRPCKLGIDKDTQIQPGELWNFREAMAPITENLSAAVIEQALLELVQEEELAMLMEQQKVYESKKNSELERLRRLQARQQIMVEENAQRVREEIETVEKAREAGKAISVAMFTKNYLQGILSSSMDLARKDGVLKNAKTAEQEDAALLLQWVESETNKSICIKNISRQILDDVMRSALNIKSDHPASRHSQSQPTCKGLECIMIPRMDFDQKSTE